MTLVASRFDYSQIFKCDLCKAGDERLFYNGLFNIKLCKVCDKKIEKFEGVLKEYQEEENRLIEEEKKKLIEENKFNRFDIMEMDE